MDCLISFDQIYSNIFQISFQGILKWEFFLKKGDSQPFFWCTGDSQPLKCQVRSKSLAKSQKRKEKKEAKASLAILWWHVHT